VLRKKHISVLLGIFCLAAVAAAPVPAATHASARSSLLEAVNAARKAHHLQPLRIDPALGRAAESHTLDMLHGDYFSHGDFAGRMLDFHLRGVLGENLAWSSGGGDPRLIVQMWLASPPHRANLLRPGFRRVGLGVVRGTFQGSAGATVVTADFGS